MPRQFLAMVRVELLKVFSRGSGIGAILTALGVGVIVALAMKEVGGWQDQMQFNGQPVRGMLNFDVVAVGRWTLWIRNVLVMPLLLLLCAAGSFAGEHADRTLRELAVRPVSRWSILLAKWVALSVLSAVTLVATAAAALTLGWALLGPPSVDQAIATGGDSLTRLGLGFAASWVSDLAVIAIGLSLSTFVRSVGGVVVSLVLVFMVDRAAWLVLWAMSLLGLEQAGTAMKLTLVSAVGWWDGWESEFALWRFAYVLGVAAAAFGLAVLRFGRVDVP